MLAANVPRTVDLNADLGEGIGDDPAMLGLVSSANVACGFHAGGPDLMAETFDAARRLGVAVGAHPGYDDRPNFGRLVVPMTEAAIERMVAYQVGAAVAVAQLAGHRLSHVKAHGALYNLAATDAGVARAVARAIVAVDRGLVALCLAGSPGARVTADAGLTVAAEVFADRAYLPDGSLMPRHHRGAVITAPDVVAERTLAMLTDSAITTSDGTRLVLPIDSICLHGDTPGAVALAGSLRAALQAAGWRIAALVP